MLLYPVTAAMVQEYVALRNKVAKWRDHSAWYSRAAHHIVGVLDEHDLQHAHKHPVAPKPANDKTKQPVAQPVFNADALEEAFLPSLPHSGGLNLNEVADVAAIAHTAHRIAVLYRLRCADT